MKTGFVALSVLVIGLLLFGCSQSAAPASATPSSSPAGSPTAVPAEVATAKAPAAVPPLTAGEATAKPPCPTAQGYQCTLGGDCAPGYKLAAEYYCVPKGPAVTNCCAPK